MPKPLLKIEGLEFKAISEEDMAFLLYLYSTTRWQEVLQAPWDDEQRHAFLKQQFDAQHFHYQKHYLDAEYLVIIKDNQNIGRIYIDSGEASIGIIDIALIPEFKYKGIGTQILKEIIKDAQMSGRKIDIHVESFNPAYQWYENLGFKQVEDRGVYQYMEWHPA
jgi:ribosomal protein S18 acetylase RimI-like enzyme